MIKIFEVFQFLFKYVANGIDKNFCFSFRPSCYIFILGMFSVIIGNKRTQMIKALNCEFQSVALIMLLDQIMHVLLFFKMFYIVLTYG